MKDSDLDAVRKIVLSGLGEHKARIFLFGSRANGKAGRASDIDVGVLPVDELPIGLLSEIRSSLEESNVPYEVDPVDLSHAEQELRRRVMEEGILWRDSGND